MVRKLKLKGAYWYPTKFPDDISNAQPPAWHKDFSALVATKAAVAAMVEGVPVEKFVRGHSDPFDFAIRAKVDRSSRLYIGDREVQRVCRYYISTSGAPLRKVMPPKGPEGTWKRKNGISDWEYHSISQEVGPGVWDARIHTANHSKYEQREQHLQADFLVTDCSDMKWFDWSSVNYDWYIDQARKLIIE